MSVIETWTERALTPWAVKFKTTAFGSLGPLFPGMRITGSGTGGGGGPFVVISWMSVSTLGGGGGTLLWSGIDWGTTSAGGGGEKELIPGTD